MFVRREEGSDEILDQQGPQQAGNVVRVGDRVSRKQLIGYSGNTGFTSGPHLHFVIFRAIDGFKRESFPMRFRTSAGTSSPVKGQSYTSAD